MTDGIELWGMEEMRRINAQITGKCGLYDEAAGLWAWCVYQVGNKDVLDIGTAFGASAILAARVKQQYGLKGTVYTLDPFTAEGEWQSSPDIAAENFQKCGVQVTLNHLPTAYEARPWGAVLIDGDHDEDAVITDWRWHGKSAEIVMFHDADQSGVRAAADEIIDKMMADDTLFSHFTRNNCTVIRRKNA